LLFPARVVLSYANRGFNFIGKKMNTEKEEEIVYGQILPLTIL